MSLPDISLDPRNENELLEQAAQYAIDKSGGQLGNLSPANPLIFLLEAQVFAGAELLWYLNQLPQKLLITFLNYWGVSTSPGSASTGDLTVTLTGVLGTAITLPSGLLFSDGETLFKSISSVIVPAGSTTVTVPVECVDLGKVGNKSAYTINNIVTPNAYLKTVTNPLPFVSGAEPRDTDQAVSDFVGNLRSDQCLSEADYLRTSHRFLGPGWDVRVIANTDPTTNQNEIGSVAVLVGNPRNIEAPTATMIALQQHLTQKAPITSRVWVSTIQYQPVVIKVYATYSQGQTSLDLANQIYELIQDYLLTSPTKISDRDLTVLGDRVGVKVTASSLNQNSSVVAQTLRNALYLKYLEIQLTPDNDDMIRGDDTRLLGSTESGELFIFGQGDED